MSELPNEANMRDQGASCDVGRCGKERSRTPD